MAAEIYAKRQQLGTEAIGYATEIKMEALRQLGRMLAETPRAVGGERGGKRRIDNTRRESSNPTPTLVELGLNPKISALAQAVFL